jgi:hypothetical protein
LPPAPANHTASDDLRVEPKHCADILEGKQHLTVRALDPPLSFPAKKERVQVLRAAAPLDAANGILEDGKGEAQFAFPLGPNTEQVAELGGQERLRVRRNGDRVTGRVETTVVLHGVPPHDRVGATLDPVGAPLHIR